MDFMKQKILFLLAMLFCISLQTMAQTDGDNPEDREVDMDTPTFEPMVKVGKVLLDKDSIQYVQVKQRVCLSTACVQKRQGKNGLQPTGV